MIVIIIYIIFTVILSRSPYIFIKSDSTATYEESIGSSSSPEMIRNRKIIMEQPIRNKSSNDFLPYNYTNVVKGIREVSNLRKMSFTHLKLPLKNTTDLPYLTWDDVFKIRRVRLKRNSINEDVFTDNINNKRKNISKRSVEENDNEEGKKDIKRKLSHAIPPVVKNTFEKVWGFFENTKNIIKNKIINNKQLNNKKLFTRKYISRKINLSPRKKFTRRTRCSRRGKFTRKHHTNRKYTQKKHIRKKPTNAITTQFTSLKTEKLKQEKNIINYNHSPASSINSKEIFTTRELSEDQEKMIKTKKNKDKKSITSNVSFIVSRSSEISGFIKKKIKKNKKSTINDDPSNFIIKNNKKNYNYYNEISKSSTNDYSISKMISSTSEEDNNNNKNINYSEKKSVSSNKDYSISKMISSSSNDDKEDKINKKIQKRSNLTKELNKNSDSSSTNNNNNNNNKQYGSSYETISDTSEYDPFKPNEKINFTPIGNVEKKILLFNNLITKRKRYRRKGKTIKKRMNKLRRYQPRRINEFSNDDEDNNNNNENEKSDTKHEEDNESKIKTKEITKTYDSERYYKERMKNDAINDILKDTDESVNEAEYSDRIKSDKKDKKKKLKKDKGHDDDDDDDDHDHDHDDDDDHDHDDDDDHDHDDNDDHDHDDNDDHDHDDNDDHDHDDNDDHDHDDNDEDDIKTKKEKTKEKKSNKIDHKLSKSIDDKSIKKNNKKIKKKEKYDEIMDSSDIEPLYETQENPFKIDHNKKKIDKRSAENINEIENDTNFQTDVTVVDGSESVDKFLKSLEKARGKVISDDKLIRDKSENELDEEEIAEIKRKKKQIRKKPNNKFITKSIKKDNFEETEEFKALAKSIERVNKLIDGKVKNKNKKNNLNDNYYNDNSEQKIKRKNKIKRSIKNSDENNSNNFFNKNYKRIIKNVNRKSSEEKRLKKDKNRNKWDDFKVFSDKRMAKKSNEIKKSTSDKSEDNNGNSVPTYSKIDKMLSDSSEKDYISSSSFGDKSLRYKDYKKLNYENFIRESKNSTKKEEILKNKKTFLMPRDLLRKKYKKRKTEKEKRNDKRVKDYNEILKNEDIYIKRKGRLTMVPNIPMWKRKKRDVSSSNSKKKSTKSKILQGEDVFIKRKGRLTMVPNIPIWKRKKRQITEMNGNKKSYPDRKKENEFERKKALHFLYSSNDQITKKKEELKIVTFIPLNKRKKRSNDDIMSAIYYCGKKEKNQNITSSKTIKIKKQRDHIAELYGIIPKEIDKENEKKYKKFQARTQSNDPRFQDKAKKFLAALYYGDGVKKPKNTDSMWKYRKHVTFTKTDPDLITMEKLYGIKDDKNLKERSIKRKSNYIKPVVDNAKDFLAEIYYGKKKSEEKIIKTRGTNKKHTRRKHTKIRSFTRRKYSLGFKRTILYTKHYRKKYTLKTGRTYKKYKGKKITIRTYKINTRTTNKEKTAKDLKGKKLD
ncbi:uncharacterized protein LOC142334056 [Lycorma delicatula]|uniref:uncharacterized protein LOC142334056 n=1 Tax=Lycorma delicatula TaxID=130591 RepID=UPI003F50D84C